MIGVRFNTLKLHTLRLYAKIIITLKIKTTLYYSFRNALIPQ